MIKMNWIAQIPSKFGLICAFLLLLNSQPGLALVDPEMVAFGGSSNGIGNPSSLNQCQEELLSCRKRSNQRGPSQEHMLDQFRQVVQSWMYSVGLQKYELPPGDSRSLSITLTLADTDLKSINKFLSDHSYDNFRSIVPVLDKLFTLKTSGYFANLYGLESETILQKKENWVHFVYDIIMSFLNVETLLVVGFLLTIFVIVKAMIFGTNPKTIAIFFILLVFIAGFLWNWAYLYKKATVDQHVNKMKYSKFASNCHQDDSFWGYVKHFFGYRATVDECTEYFRATEINPILIVPPTEVLAETLAMILIRPLILMAEGMRKMTEILFGDRMWGMYLGTPIVMIMVSVMVSGFFLLLSGQRFKLKIFHLIQFETGQTYEQYLPTIDQDGRAIEGRRVDRNSESASVTRHPGNMGHIPDASTSTNCNTNSRPDTTCNTHAKTKTCNSNSRPDTCCNTNVQTNCKHAENSCCSVKSPPVCSGHSVSHCRQHEPLLSFTTRHFPENSNSMPSDCINTSTIRNRRRPFRNVTDRYTNNYTERTRNREDSGDIVEEFMFARRRKFSI